MPVTLGLRVLVPFELYLKSNSNHSTSRGNSVMTVESIYLGHLFGQPSELKAVHDGSRRGKPSHVRK